MASRIKRVGGFRSGLEKNVADQLTNAGVEYEYEPQDKKIRYAKPLRSSLYTYDFQLANGLIIETKGRFLAEDRAKHLLIKEQYPDLDIRFVFSSSKAKLNKTSKTTYANWCDKHGFKYADKQIPLEWINE